MLTNMKTEIVFYHLRHNVLGRNKSVSAQLKWSDFTRAKDQEARVFGVGILESFCHVNTLLRGPRKLPQWPQVNKKILELEKN